SASLITVIILSVSVLIKGWMYLFNKKIGGIASSSALKATAIDSLSDAITTLAVLAALVISLVTGLNLDPYMTLAVSLFIIFSGIKNAKETLDPLLGMPPEKEMVEEIERTVMSFEYFIGIHDLVVHNYGPGRTFATLHVEVPDTVNITKCHEMVDDCEKLLNEKTGAEIVIHMDPIVTDNEQLNQIKKIILKKLQEQNKLYNLHDFRMVDGQGHINLVFDVVAPIDETKSDEQIKQMVQKICKDQDSRYNAVVTVDRDYLGRT
ncbi:MAG: cation diffusion facilitator family transporter, partial [Oscillospiraceae bacterium]|nr:cation diffusion facilitator family transporter [Candidatus Equicaccousia limihippi]